MLPRYKAAVAAMDTVVTNSQNVNNRLHRYLGITGVVVHPPCETERFFYLVQENYYVSTARLDPLKRVDQIVKAFLKMPRQKIIVTSGGPELKSLRFLAGEADNIIFTDWISDDKIQELIGKATAKNEIL